MVDYLRVNGRMIKDMAEALNVIQTEIFIKGNFNMVKHMERVDINGKIQMKFMMESGLKA
jgi:hypothetical protein